MERKSSGAEETETEKRERMKGQNRVSRSPHIEFSAGRATPCSTMDAWKDDPSITPHRKRILQLM